MIPPELKSRLQNLPVYERSPGEVAAAHFNRVRLALLRLDGVLRCPLARLRGLDMILTTEFWVCVDRTLNDVPVIAWVDLQVHGRASLIAPVRCEVRRYHAHADRLLNTLWEDLMAELDQRLGASE